MGNQEQKEWEGIVWQGETLSSMRQMCRSCLPWLHGRSHQTCVSPCPVQRRVACSWGHPRALLPISQAFSFPLLQLPRAEFPSLAIALVVRGTPASVCRSQDHLPAHCVEQPRQGKSPDRATAECQREGCSPILYLKWLLLSGAGSSVSQGLQETLMCLLLLLQEAECGSAVGPCQAGGRAHRHNSRLPWRAPHRWFKAKNNTAEPF